MSRLRFVCLVGPTGVGKSALAIRLAREFDGEIVNADSRQVYRAFPLITAQPSSEERKACPHALYGFLDTQESLSAGAWAGLALKTAQAIADQGGLPLLVGGTGFYLRALTDGIATIPPVAPSLSARLAEECAKLGPGCLHARLAIIDPAYASRIHPNDRQRVLRALEVYESTGRTFSWWHAQTPPPLEADVLRIGIGLPLQTLTPQLAARVERMLEAGAAEEARREFARCPDDGPGWSGIGCRELQAWLRGTCELEQARELWIKNTRAYAKRQLTWFNADERIRWFTPDDLAAVPGFIRKWLHQ